MATKPPPSIIIADNNAFWRQVLGDFYRENGFEVRVATDGLEALEMLQKRRADLLVLDLIMPRLDGARLCSFVKSQDAYRDLPVIILSGILADEIEDVEAIGADAYIAKMPHDQIAEPLRQLSHKLLLERTGADPILCGFEKMYRREVVLELLQQCKSSQKILDSLSEGIVELSEARQLLASNRAFQEMAGCPTSKLLSRPIEEIFPESEHVLLGLFAELDRGAAMASAIIHHGERELRAKLHRFKADPAAEKRREASPSAVSKSVDTAVELAARASSKVQLQSMVSSAGYALLMEDVTEKAKAEREREHLRRRLAQSEKLQAAGLLVSGVAHELNNPLAGVMGFAQLLLKVDTDERVHRGLEKINHEAERCKKIVQNLETFARKHKPQKHYVGINGILESTLELRSYHLKVDDIEVVSDLDPDLPKTMADFHQLQQVFLNVIVNAHQAMMSCGRKGTLTLRTRRRDDQIIIDIEDNGPGIDPQNLGRIFDPFFTTKEVGQGTGLGLSICYSIIEEHKGRIHARNAPGSGTILTVELPILGPDSPREDPARRAREEPSPTASGKNILVVDDEPAIIDILYQALRMDGHRVDTALNGAVALRKIEKQHYDLIICDLKMPSMGGVELYEKVRELNLDLAGRIIFTTGDLVSTETQEFLEKCSNAYVRKPFEIDMIRRVVRSALVTTT